MADIFWTDRDQATQRLRGSVVVKGNKPFYVMEIEAGRDTLRAAGAYCGDTLGKIVRVSLGDEDWNNFRTLPKLGWMNVYSEEVNARYLLRLPRRASSHGLTAGNLGVGTVSSKTGQIVVGDSRTDFNTTISDFGFLAMHEGNYPSLTEVIQGIRENSCIAVGRQYAVIRDVEGLRWLAVGTDRVGILTDVNTLLLSNKFSFLKESLMEASEITIQNITEF